ncbi:hypothetical protein [Rhizobium leguminosarum]
MSTAVPAKLEDAAANAGFWTAPAPSNANPPSTIFLRVHGIGNIPLKPSSELSVNQIFHLPQQKNHILPKGGDRFTGLLCLVLPHCYSGMPRRFELKGRAFITFEIGMYSFRNRLRADALHTRQFLFLCECLHKITKHLSRNAWDHMMGQMPDTFQQSDDRPRMLPAKPINMPVR